MPQTEQQQREIYYLGDVQGIGFRYTARSVARQFAVAGFVRNLSDGRVQIVVEGTASEIRAFLKAIQAEMGRHISETQETVLPYSGQFRSFDVRY